MTKYYTPAEIRRELRANNYQIQNRKWTDSPIINIGGYEAGRVERDSGRVFVSYAVEAESLPAVMRLHELCQEKGLPYVVSDIYHRADRLNGEIDWRNNLLKGIKKLAKRDRKNNLSTNLNK